MWTSNDRRALAYLCEVPTNRARSSVGYTFGLSRRRSRVRAPSAPPIRFAQQPPLGGFRVSGGLFRNLETRKATRKVVIFASEILAQTRDQTVQCFRSGANVPRKNASRASARARVENSRAARDISAHVHAERRQWHHAAAAIHVLDRFAVDHATIHSHTIPFASPENARRPSALQATLCTLVES